MVRIALLSISLLGFGVASVSDFAAGYLAVSTSPVCYKCVGIVVIGREVPRTIVRAAISSRRLQVIGILGRSEEHSTESDSGADADRWAAGSSIQSNVVEQAEK